MQVISFPFCTGPILRRVKVSNIIKKPPLLWLYPSSSLPPYLCFLGFSQICSSISLIWQPRSAQPFLTYQHHEKDLLDTVRHTFSYHSYYRVCLFAGLDRKSVV